MSIQPGLNRNFSFGVTPSLQWGPYRIATQGIRVVARGTPHWGSPFTCVAGMVLYGKGQVHELPRKPGCIRSEACSLRNRRSAKRGIFEMTAVAPCQELDIDSQDRPSPRPAATPLPKGEGPGVRAKGPLGVGGTRY